MNNLKKQNITFVHSLFRSGSTFFYNALKRTGQFHAFHEPLHEVIADLSDEWNNLASKKTELQTMLRHGFLQGSYFDEYAHLLPVIKKTFDASLSFEWFFMDERSESVALETYLNTLIEGSSKSPVLQCTRTVGRVRWLRKHYVANHIFLLRNPWDQWYSYKVDQYIAATPRLIYSQPNLPSVLKEILDASELQPLPGVDTTTQLLHSFANSISPQNDYFLFFGLWLYAFIVGHTDCDICIDMDDVSSNKQTREKILITLLAKTSLTPINLDDISLHRTIFVSEELNFYKTIEDQIIEIFRRNTTDIHLLESAQSYLDKQRQLVFIIPGKEKSTFANTLEDSRRLRKILQMTGQLTTQRVTNLNQTLAERDGQIANLNQTLTERNAQITNLNQTLAERDGHISALYASSSWRLTAPFTQLMRQLRSTPKTTKDDINSQIISTRGADAFFTICAKNFLAHARVLYNSVQPHYPNAKFFVVLCDRVDGYFDPALEPFEFVYLENLDLPNLNDMAERYNITEFNTSIKPFAFTHLMNKYNFNSVIYLDPDLLLVDKMVELDLMLSEGVEAILTPHILQPAENDEVHDGKMLLFGIYNLGFLALKNTPSVHAFLAWWGRRLTHHCVIRLEQGLFVDQKWADLLPAFVPNTRLIRHPGYNVAYWNLPQRKILKRKNKWFSNDLPLRFVHFSGNNIDNPKIFSRHSQQVNIRNIGDLKYLLDFYREQVLEQGHQSYRKLPYAFNWNGKSGINLHTPQMLCLATQESNSKSVTVNGKLLVRMLNKFSSVQRALPIARKISGGWLPLAQRVWNLYQHKGWAYIKSKVIELSDYRSPPIKPSSQLLANRKDTSVKLRLLYIDWAIPKPDHDAGSVLAASLMKIFRSLDYRITFVPCNLKYEQGYYEALYAEGIDVICHPHIESVESWLRVNASRFDIAVLSRGPVVWPYISLLKEVASNLRLVFHTGDLHYIRELREAELTNDPKAKHTSLVTRDHEFDLIKQCDLTILVSSEELYTVRRIYPEASLALLPAVFEDIPGIVAPFEARRDILFIGSFPHLPNIDAVVYFAEEIFPIIQNHIPDIKFKVVGANPPERIKKLAINSAIEVLGFVKELAPLFEGIRLSVAPLRYGAGIKGKIGSSLCYGVPCIATPIAVEGMNLVNGKNVLVGESPEEFSSAVCQAYLDKELWLRISASGHQFSLAKYSVNVIRQRVKNLLFAVTENWRPIEGAVEIDTWESFQRHSKKMSDEYTRRLLREQALLPSDDSESFSTSGFCCVCKKETFFHTGFIYSTGPTPDCRVMPNWREHTQCVHCRLVNRIRAAFHALHTLAPPEEKSRIYITEQITATYKWLQLHYPHLQGSEYFGPDIESGAIVDGIRNEDVMNLSFADSSFDRVLSFDVLEHVPDPDKAFREIYRVLDNDGVLLFTVPFSADSPTDIIRATLTATGEIEHHLPAEYHGNPVDPEGGALCFRYFGWETLDRLRDIGFNQAQILAYWSEKQGYLGKEQYLFIAKK